MAILNTRQIAKSNNRTKLIEFNDNLSYNDFTDEAGVKRSTIHSKFSRIQVTIVDWTAGKGEKAVVVNHNITPQNMKLLAEMVLHGDVSEFEKQDKYSKQKGYFEQKINHRNKDEKGLSPVTRFNVYYQPQMSAPWTITIENGLGVAAVSNIGGISIKSGSYQKQNSATVYLSKTEMVLKMLEVRDYIMNFEQNFFRDMIIDRTNFEEKLKENGYKQ